jgi:hypothetical protein
MPTVTVGTTTIECDHGAILRDVLQRYDLGIDPHNGAASVINCRHHRKDTGTSNETITSTDTNNSVEMTADIDTSSSQNSTNNRESGDAAARINSRTAIERVRLSVPPHTSDSELRLACQTRVLDDIRVIKHDGLWGHHTDDDQDK